MFCFSWSALNYNFVRPIILFCLFQLFFCICAFSANAEQLSVRRIGNSDGLSHFNVRGAIEDEYGRIWFATANGINIYDGYEFLIFRHLPENPNSPSSSDIATLFRDSHNQIWVGTLGGGINRFVPEFQNFIPYGAGDNYEMISLKGEALSVAEIRAGAVDEDRSATGAAPGSRGVQDSPHDVFKFFEDKSGILWAGTDDGLMRYDRENDKFISVFKDANGKQIIPSSAVKAIAQTENGKLWLGFDKEGLCHFNIETSRCKMFQHFIAVKGSLTSNHVRALHVDKNDTLWIGTSNGINRLKFGEDEFTNFNLDYLPNSISLANNKQVPDDREITSFAADNLGSIWIGTENGGVNRYDLLANEFNYIQYSPSDNHTLASNNVSFVFVDSNERVWVGSHDAGVSSFSAKGSEFAHFRHDPLLNLGPQSNNIWSFANSPDGSIWVGSRRGLDRFIPWSEEFIPYLSKGNKLNDEQVSHVHSLLSDGLDLWIGTKSQGLFKFNAVNRALENWNSVFFDGSLHELRGIKHLRKDNKDRLWLADANGLFWLQTKTGIIEQVNLKPVSLFSEFQQLQVSSLYQDKEGNMWVGTLKELYRYDMKLERFERISLNGKSFPNVNAIYQQEKNIFWLATNSGLYHLDMLQGRLQHFDERNNFPTPILFSLIPDRVGNFWITTNNGLVRFNTTLHNVDVFTFYDGLQNNGFNRGAYMQTASGTIYVGGVNGFNLFEPSKVQDQSTSKTLLRAKVVGKDGSVLIITPKDGKIELPYRHDRIEFVFSPIHFKNPAGNRFEYRLFNHDTAWRKGVARDDNRRVNYDDLPPGNYKFELRTSGSIGVWSAPVKIEIEISEPIWNTGWAYLFYFILMLALIAALVRWRNLRLMRHAKHLKKQVDEQTTEIIQKNQELEQLLDFRSRFYRRAAHELRTPLTLVQLPLQEYVAEQVEAKSGEYQPQKVNALVMVLRNIQRLKRITDQMLRYSKNIHDEKADLQIIDLPSTLLPLLDMSEKSATEKGIQFYQDKIPKAAVTLDRDALEDIVVNLLSNAIKYTAPGGKVSFNIHLNKASLEIEVSDTGIGISKEDIETIFKPYFRGEEVEGDDNGFGVGLSVVKERIELSGSEISLYSDKNKGTEFRVVMPVSMPSVDELSDLPENISAAEIWPANVLKHERPHLLVVEDDPDMCTLLRSILSTEFNADIVNNSKEARQKIIEMSYDAIITDALLPDGNGFELLENLKTQPEASHIPIILLTALAEREHMERALELGADDYVVKPFSASELVLRIKSHISNRDRVGQWWQKQLESDYANLEETTEKLTTQRVLSPKDSAFLDVLRAFVEEEMGKSELTLPIAAKGVAVSERQIQRKLKSLLNSTFTEYVTELRMRKGATLLETGLSVKVVSSMVGYNDASHFAALFKERFGVAPSKFKSKALNGGDTLSLEGD